MTRLTKNIREIIVNNAVKKSGINNRLEELRLKRADWLERVRQCAFDCDTPERIDRKIKKMLSEVSSELIINSECFNKYSYVNLNVAGSSLRMYFNGDLKQGINKNIYKITPHRITLKADNPLTDQFYELEKERIKLGDEKEDIINGVLSIVQSVTTVKRLLEVWPESEELLPKMGKPVSGLPAVKVDEVNKKVGLCSG